MKFTATLPAPALDQAFNALFHIFQQKRQSIAKTLPGGSGNI
jgi:hypothetical protein